MGQAQSRCYSHLSAALLPFLLFLLFTFGKEVTMTTLLPLLHPVFAFRLHQSSSPSSSNMHAVPWSLVSLQFACENNVKLFFLLQAFFQLNSDCHGNLFLIHFFPDSLRKNEKKCEREKKTKNRCENAEQSMVQVGEESTT